MRFPNRCEAGKFLAEELLKRGYGDDALVLALPRGGIPVGYEVGRVLGAVLDVFVVRKLGFPGHEELAMGAIASGGTTVLDEALIDRAGVSRDTIDAVISKEQHELERREKLYRDGRPRVAVDGRDIILVDDGLATGSTMRAAIRALRKMAPKSIMAAVPVGAEETCAVLKSEADDVLCATTPDPFQAVGLWYDDFTQTTDEQVREYLRKAFAQKSGTPAPPQPSSGAGRILL